MMRSLLFISIGLFILCVVWIYLADSKSQSADTLESMRQALIDAGIEPHMQGNMGRKPLALRIAVESYAQAMGWRAAGLTCPCMAVKSEESETGGK